MTAKARRRLLFMAGIVLGFVAGRLGLNSPAVLVGAGLIGGALLVMDASR